MSLPYSPSRAIFEGNGITTRFPFSFTVWNSTQLQVSLTDTAGNTSTAQGWQVELSATGGTLIYELNNAPLPAGYSLAITRAMPFTQEIDLVSGTRFDAEAIEIAFDKACAERQQLREALARAVKLPETSLDTPENLVQNIYTARNEAQTAASHAAASEIAAASSAALANTTVQAGLVSLEGARAEAVTAVGTAKSTALAAITDSQNAAVSTVQTEGAAQISAATTQANSAEASATAAAASAEAADTVLASAQTTISAAQSAAVTAVTTQQGTSIAAVETAQNTAIAAVGTEQATAIAAVQTQQASSTAAVQTEGAAQIALATAQADAAAASATAATGFATAAAGSAANAALSAEQASASANLSDASLTVKGIVMLSNAVGSTDETKSATPAAVKIAYDRASTGINAAAAAQTTANAAKAVTDLVSITPAAGKIPQADENGKINDWVDIPVGVPVGTVIAGLWKKAPSTLFMIADGSLALFADYPELESAFIAGILPVEETANSSRRTFVKYTVGGAITGLYLPNLNGVFLRNTTTIQDVGKYFTDTGRRSTGSYTPHARHSPFYGNQPQDAIDTAKGCFYRAPSSYTMTWAIEMQNSYVPQDILYIDTGREWGEHAGSEFAPAHCKMLTCICVGKPMRTI
jgi:hypothetical protein